MTHPTFICVGPGRTGTSWLREMLEKHPQISMSSVKETEYYNNYADKGMDWYLSHFPEQGNHAIGEISNMYYLDESIAGRIKADFPNAKIIFAYRDPHDLLKSFYQFGVRRGVAKDTLTEALDESIGIYMGTGHAHRLANDALVAADQPSLLDSVMLSRWLTPYLETFDRERVFLLDYTRIANDGKQLLAELYAFLDVNADFKPDGVDEVVNAAAQPRSQWLARLAHHTAFVLRQLGLNQLLSALHKSRLIKALLFRSPHPNQPRTTPAWRCPTKCTRYSTQSAPHSVHCSPGTANTPSSPRVRMPRREPSHRPRTGRSENPDHASILLARHPTLRNHVAPYSGADCAKTVAR